MTIYVRGTEQPEGQFFLGTKSWVYVSTQDTYMFKYNSPRGVRCAAVLWSRDHGAEWVEQVFPKRILRVRISLLEEKARKAQERGQWQYFLKTRFWDQLPRPAVHYSAEEYFSDSESVTIEEIE